MDVLRDMFPTRSALELEQMLNEASQDFDRAVELLLERPTPGPSRPRPLKDLAKRTSIISEPPPLTPATASAISFGKMTLSGESERQKEVPTPRRRTFIDISEEDSKPATSERDAESETVSHILAIFPEACPESIKRLYQEHQTLQGASIAEFLANKYAEEGYVKIEKVGQKRKRKQSEDDDEEEVDARKKSSYDPEGRPTPSIEYRKLVERLLQQEFPVTPVNYINKIYKANKLFLASTYPHLVAAEKLVSSKDPNPPYKPLLSRRKIMDEGAVPKMGKVWTEITDELEYARMLARKTQMQQQLEADAKIAAELNEKEHEATNMLWECQCCFTETPFDNMTHCSEGAHFFCLDCARMNAENEIGNGRHKLKCMDGSGCQAEFPRREVLRFIKNEKTLALLSKLEAEEAIRVADIEGLEQCPFCDNAAICQSIEVDKEFRCDNEDCGVVSCRLCKRKSHVPQTCGEAAKDDKISQRHRIEEAMTNAMMRKCNKCKSPFIKQDGCNKMTCMKAGCYNVQCYVCSQNIIDYSHFASGPDGRRGSGKCPLFDNHEERHEEEIRKAAQAETERLRTENPDILEDDLKIQLSEEVKKREEARRKAADQGRRQGVRAGPAVIPPYIPAPPPPAPAARAIPEARQPAARAGLNYNVYAQPTALHPPVQAAVQQYNPYHYAQPVVMAAFHHHHLPAPPPPPDFRAHRQYQAPGVQPYQPHQYATPPNPPLPYHRAQRPPPPQAPPVYVPAAHSPPPASQSARRRYH